MRLAGLGLCLTFVYFGLSPGTERAVAAPTSVRMADGESILLNAQNAERDFESQTITLTGQVQIIYGQQSIRCDRAVINLRLEEIHAEGGLVILSPQAYVEGDTATLNYRDNTGTISNGFVRSGQVVFEGRIVRKTGPETYEADDAQYTACTTCPPAWSFSGTKITAEMGGYAHIKNSIFEIANFPVLWLPYLIVPLKSERQTGLLIPSLDFTGKGGVAVTLPFFWAISRSQDATFYLKNYANRGLKGLLNYRYVLSPTSLGELDIGVLNDQIYAEEEIFGQPGISPGTSSRWLLTYNHYYDLPYGFVQRARFNLLSDLLYQRDFPEEIPGQGDPALENRVSLTRNTHSTHSSLDVSYYLNLLKTDPTSSNRDAVHRWPALRHSIIEQAIGETGFLFNFNSEYVNFARDDFAYDDVIVSGSERSVDQTRSSTPQSGVFNPGTDLIRAGQRIDIEPEISYPFRLGSHLDVLPLIQFRHTQYSFNITPAESAEFDTSPYRQYIRGQVSVRMPFYKLYDGGLAQAAIAAPASVRQPSPFGSTQQTPSGWIDSESGAVFVPPPPPPRITRRYRHELVPELIFGGVPYIKNTDSPFFGESLDIPSFLDNQPVSDSDFQSVRGLQFDYNDRFFHRNTLAFVLDNRLVEKSWIGGKPLYTQIASLKLRQSYDFDEASRDSEQRFAWSDISALLDVRLGHFETNTLIRYFPYHNVTNTSSRVRLKRTSSDYVEVRFNQTHLITQNISESSEQTENIGFAAGFDTRYLGLVGSVNYLPEDLLGLHMKLKSWGTELNFKPPGDCWGIRLSFRQDIGSETLYMLDFDYKFGGENG